MNCNQYKEQLTLLVTDSLDAAQRQELEKHLAGCPDCRMELEASLKVWNLMGEFPKPLPSETLRTGFEAVLNKYKEESKPDRKSWQGLGNVLGQLWRLQPRLQLAYACILLLLGFSIGYMLSRPTQREMSYDKQVSSLSSQVTEMKQMMMLSLLENPSASERIKAVGYTDDIGNVNQKVIDALLTTLNEDPNLNVRLITLEALVKFSKEASVREGLVKSITHQDSPLLQSAIADVMVKLQEKRSVNSLQKLLNKKNLNGMVKVKIEQSIRKLT
jgi:hypothetical protein